MRRRLLRWGAVLGLLAILFHAEQGHAQTPTEKVAECVSGAWDAYNSCIESNPWYYLWPCGWKLEADVILCVPSMVLGPLKT